MFKKFKMEISKERFDVVHKEISEGSEPAVRFYILVAISTLIAGFGLITNSTAVVIGAMLVAPLMTPIFGMALALVRGDAKLFGHAVRAEIVGVVAAVCMGMLLGLLIPIFEPTHEMLVRTKPNLFDLIVAVLAGMAGSYALVDEKISPALPGVAIATAIVPPLANSGLCFALGATAGGVGSFLLFFANFLSVLLVASATFFICGMARDHGTGITKKDFLRRFGLAGFSFLFVAGVLSHSLFNILEERREMGSVYKVFKDELKHIPATGLDSIKHFDDGNSLYVLAQVHTANVLSPNQVKRIQDLMTKAVGKPTKLIVRSISSNDVSAQGTAPDVITASLNGDMIVKNKSPIATKTFVAEQALREYFNNQIAVELRGVEYLPLSKRPVVLATVAGFKDFEPNEIRGLEGILQKKTKDPTLSLVIRQIRTNFYNEDGRLRYGWTGGHVNITSDQYALLKQMKSSLTIAMKKSTKYHQVNVSGTYHKKSYNLLLEVVGPELFPQKEVKRLTALLQKEFNKPVNVYVFSKLEAVVTATGYNSWAELNHEFSVKQDKDFSQEVDRLLEAAAY